MADLDPEERAEVARDVLADPEVAEIAVADYKTAETLREARVKVGNDRAVEADRQQRERAPHITNVCDEYEVLGRLSDARSSAVAPDAMSRGHDCGSGGASTPSAWC